MGSKLASWLIYRVFLYLSKKVSFTDFTIIWNSAYNSHCEAEWMRLKKQSLSTKFTQGTLGDYPEVKQKGLPSNLTWLKPELNDGLSNQQDHNLTL